MVHNEHLKHFCSAVYLHDSEEIIGSTMSEPMSRTFLEIESMLVGHRLLLSLHEVTVQAMQCPQECLHQTWCD